MNHMPRRIQTSVGDNKIDIARYPVPTEMKAHFRLVRKAIETQCFNELTFANRKSIVFKL